jgi:hypothetical protein
LSLDDLCGGLAEEFGHGQIQLRGQPFDLPANRIGQWQFRSFHGGNLPHAPGFAQDQEFVQKVLNEGGSNDFSPLFRLFRAFRGSLLSSASFTSINKNFEQEDTETTESEKNRECQGNVRGMFVRGIKPQTVASIPLTNIPLTFPLLLRLLRLFAATPLFYFLCKPHIP